MTPELFNMIGAVLLVIIGMRLGWAVPPMKELDSSDEIDAAACLSLVALAVVITGLVIIVSNWAQLGQSLFGGGR